MAYKIKIENDVEVIVISGSESESESESEGEDMDEDIAEDENEDENEDEDETKDEDEIEDEDEDIDNPGRLSYVTVESQPVQDREPSHHSDVGAVVECAPAVASPSRPKVSQPQDGTRVDIEMEVGGAVC
jgi:hypothetical protein